MRHTGTEKLYLPRAIADIYRPETLKERGALLSDKLANDKKNGYNTQSNVLSACIIPTRPLRKKKDREGNERSFYDPVPETKVIYLDDQDQDRSEEVSRRIRAKSTYLAWQCFWESIALRDAAK